MTTNFSRAEQIAIGFITRDFSLKSIGMNETFATEEVLRLRQCCCAEDYYRARRIGSFLPLSRKGRMSVWGLYQNAKKHASIEEEMKEAGVL